MQKVSTDVIEGMVLPGFSIDAQGQSHQVHVNILKQSSLKLASAAPLALNRIMMNDVRKRLGDICTSESTHGAWARYDGGKLSGEGGLGNDFHTVQMGIDTVPTADSARMGVAFSYTDSDAEYVRDNTDMKAYSIAMYGTKVFDNGIFVDVIARMGTAEYDADCVNSLLGRVGFAAGLKYPSDIGNVYVRASAVHEFLGDFCKDHWNKLRTDGFL